MSSLIYFWSGSVRICCEGSSDQIHKLSGNNTLIIVAEGSGALTVNERDYALDTGKCLLLRTGTVFRFTNRSAGRLIAHLVEFASSEDLIQEMEMRPNSFSRVTQLAEALYDHRDMTDRAAGSQVWFQELLFRVTSSENNKQMHAVQSVERTIQLIQEYSALDLTLGELSETTDLSSRHYSRIFRRLTGKSPIDYLIEQRINHAEKLLSTPGASIQEIARSVGFRDPFHFSRSFKRHLGVSPRTYLQLRKQRIRVASLQFLGEMLALGIKPIGAPSQLLASTFYNGYVDGIEAIGDTVVTPYMDKLSEMKPDLILTFNGHSYSDYSKIALTLDVPWSLPFFDRFRFIARLIGKSEAAEAWISLYHDRIAEAKEQLSSFIAPRQTVSLFWMKGLPVTFQVYYEAGILYRDLGFAAPPVVAKTQLKKGHPFKEDIPIEKLPMYSGDIIFVVVSSDAESEAQFNELADSSHWKGLGAVQTGQFYRITQDWLREDPIALMRQAGETVRLIHGAESR